MLKSPPNIDTIIATLPQAGTNDINSNQPSLSP
jgi:hypothetical protein